MRPSILLGLLVLSFGCGGPFAMIPGGALSGPVQSAPSDWSFTNDVENIQLETRPEDPYSVTLWGVGVGSDFYVASGGGTESTWAQNIDANPDVRLRVGDDVYELLAVRTQEPADRERFLAAARLKYDNFEPSEEDASKAVLYRLEAR